MLWSFEDITENETPTKTTQNETVNTTALDVIDLDQVQSAYFLNDEDAVIVYQYNPKKIMKIRTRILAKTTVFLPKGDTPVSFANGSPEAFNVELSKETDSRYDLSNTFTISSKYVGSDTTLTIIGKSGRVYNFYTYSIGSDSKLIPNSTVFVTKDGQIPEEVERIDLNEKDKEIIALKEEINSYKEKLSIQEQKITKNLKQFDITNIQIDYTFKEDNDFKLDAIFNDDEFTYFKFKEGFNIPRFYFIDEKKDKINLNFIIFENIIKVQKLAKNWSLELNGDYLEVQKEGIFDIKYSNKKLFVDMTKTKYNISSYHGDATIAPKKVFFDDKFTYFKFDITDGFSKFPIIHRVIDGYDNPVAFEIINDYVVVKLLNDKFTLRLGEKTNCVKIKE
jgi:type IV secretory pathway VirB9-like protein